MKDVWYGFITCHNLHNQSIKEGKNNNNNNNTRDTTLLQTFKKYDILGGRRHIVPLTIKFKPH